MILGLLLGVWLTPFGSLDLAAQDTSSVSRPEVSSTSAEGAENPSDRPGLQDFIKDLADNSLDLFSGDNLLPLLIGTGATAATHSVDGSVRDYFDGGDRFGVFERILGERVGRGPVVLGAVGGLWTFSRFYGSDKLARLSDDLAQASALTGLLTFGLKRGVGRVRPDGSNSLSFPSGHSSTAFTVATIVDHHYGRPASIAAYAAASFVAASRLDAGKHYLSDVVAGATLGYIVGRTVTRSRIPGISGITWVPILSPSTESLGIAFSWQFGP